MPSCDAPPGPPPPIPPAPPAPPAAVSDAGKGARAADLDVEVGARDRGNRLVHDAAPAAGEVLGALRAGRGEPGSLRSPAAGRRDLDGPGAVRDGVEVGRRAQGRDRVLGRRRQGQPRALPLAAPPAVAVGRGADEPGRGPPDRRGGRRVARGEVTGEHEPPGDVVLRLRAGERPRLQGERVRTRVDRAEHAVRGRGARAGVDQQGRDARHRAVAAARERREPLAVEDVRVPGRAPCGQPARGARLQGGPVGARGDAPALQALPPGLRGVAALGGDQHGQRRRRRLGERRVPDHVGAPGLRPRVAVRVAERRPAGAVVRGGLRGVAVQGHRPVRPEEGTGLVAVVEHGAVGQHPETLERLALADPVPAEGGAPASQGLLGVADDLADGVRVGSVGVALEGELEMGDVRVQVRRLCHDGGDRVLLPVPGVDERGGEDVRLVGTVGFVVRVAGVVQQDPGVGLDQGSRAHDRRLLEVVDPRDDPREPLQRVARRHVDQVLLVRGRQRVDLAAVLDQLLGDQVEVALVLLDLGDQARHRLGLHVVGGLQDRPRHPLDLAQHRLAVLVLLGAEGVELRVDVRELPRDDRRVDLLRLALVAEAVQDPAQALVQALVHGPRRGTLEQEAEDGLGSTREGEAEQGLVRDAGGRASGGEGGSRCRRQRRARLRARGLRHPEPASGADMREPPAGRGGHHPAAVARRGDPNEPALVTQPVASPVPPAVAVDRAGRGREQVAPPRGGADAHDGGIQPPVGHARLAAVTAAERVDVAVGRRQQVAAGAAAIPATRDDRRSRRERGEPRNRVPNAWTSPRAVASR